ncbi:hypothetical protein L2E82_06518 [Cichorium intybus]|uniref:Uncharacterized protein n=1 Tax=Cichorium intybus TaxID=13427 RepID=A0ACB9HBC0_CICIN|nr:hypothetical protein L2E82_06518 [Cichorium intybus]
MASFALRILQFLIFPGAIIFHFDLVMALKFHQNCDLTPLRPPFKSPVGSISSAPPPQSPVPRLSPSPYLPSDSTPATASPPHPSPSHPPLPSPSPSPSPSHPPPASPIRALFVLGDSSVDCGTNNFLGTFARADRLPYGRDFDTHQPTGRFCNGRIPVDFLAMRLGLPFIPSYLGQTGSVEDMIHGVNYASAGAGIIFSSGSELGQTIDNMQGQHVSFGQQIQQTIDTFQQFITKMGEEPAASFISDSIIYISIGTNDYIHYYLPNVSDVQTKYVSWKFNQFLAYSMKEEIKNLYNANVRKVVVMGLAPIGCAPYYLYQYESQDGGCIKIINNMIMEFNFVMRFTIAELRKELTDANIIFCDAYQGSMDIIKNFDHYGFSVTTEACCGLGRYNGWMMCMFPEMACENASDHIWWDQFHPTAAVNQILADNVWSGLHTPMCYPMNMEDMVK